MRGERQLLRIGEYLVGRACQRLPQDIREERYREWAAELPAILHDPQVRLAPRRAVRMLAYAADTVRGATATPARARRRIPRMTAALCLIKDRRVVRVRRMVPGPEWIVAICGAILCVVAYPFVPAVHQFMLGPSLSEMILGLMLFLIVFAVLGGVVSRALNVIAVRSAAVGGNLANAEGAQSEARRLREEYGTTISGAQLEAARIRQEAHERGARIASEGRAQALLDARRSLEDAADEIWESRVSAVAELQPQVAEIAVALSERILGEPPYERSSLEPHTRGLSAVSDPD
jgi:F-type H+-transporting ATPase subunit b